MDTPSKLRALARRHGLQVSYTDVHGTVRSASPERLTTMLQTLGAPISDPGHPEEALHVATLEAWSRPLPPVVVAWDGVGRVTVHLPEHLADAGYRLHVHSETGREIVREGSMYDVTFEAKQDLCGQRFVRRSLMLPERMEEGYHRVVLEVLGLPPSEALLVSAPRRAYSPIEPKHTWGLFVPLYALHTERSLCTADFTDLRHVTEWVAERGGSVVGTLPLLANFLDDHQFEPSPYAPASRLAWNELYLDVEAIEEFSACAEARMFWRAPETRQAIARLRALDRVDHRAQMTLMRRALVPMAELCWSRDSPRRRALEAFVRARPEIEDYARFRAVGEQQQKPWNAWPDRLKQGTLELEDIDLAAYRYHLYVQWNVHLQLNELSTQGRSHGLGLYLDLPVGVHPDGYDIWKHRDVFACGLSTGAPPDALFTGGQNWAFPPLHPRGVREDHYRYIIQVLRGHLRYAGVLRIDHVMGLHRIYAIPARAPATEGMYLRYEPDELYAILSLESHRSGTLLLGENLGTVPDEVNAAMAEHDVRGMHVVQYAARPDPDAALPPVTRNEMASINTHDMPPFRAFWQGLDADLRRELGWLDEAAAAAEKAERKRVVHALRRYLGRGDTPEPNTWNEALRALVRLLGQSDTQLVLLNLEDLWGETHPQNVPGTFREHPNWQYRARYSFERWRELPQITTLLGELDRVRKLADVRGQVRYDISLLTDDDVHFFNEGTHDAIDRVLGAHPLEQGGVAGTYFAVWAPSADYVAVVGDFNDWQPGRAPLRSRGSSGIWEGFVVGIGPGDLYKYHVAGPHISTQKIDPLAQRFEVPPRTASIVANNHYDWRDHAWLRARAQRTLLHEPVSIYEMHLGSWMRVPEDGARYLTYREAAPKLVDYVRRLGFTHVEFLPLMEHPFFPSWGYQTTGYFAPTSRYGHPADLKYLIDELHQAGIGVLLDWVPSHFPSDEHALARYDGTCLYEHSDPKEGYHPDWRSSIFNYGRYEVQSFLVSSARHWVEEYHADGLRVDAVASMLYRDYSRKEGEWIPNRYGGRENLEAIALLRRLNETIYRTSPGAQSFAEESTAWPMVSRPTYLGGLGFGFKWDMGWMHDTLQYFARDPVHRQFHHNELTFRMIYAFNENFVLPLSHDEVVHGKGSLLSKMPGDAWQKFANLRALYGYMYGQPGKKLLFQGAEFAHGREWTCEESLDWHLLDHPLHAAVLRWIADLNRLYRREPALYEYDCDPAGFEWVDFSDSTNSVYNFLRKGREGTRPVLVCCNLTPVPRTNYRVGAPVGGTWVELANSDARDYGGSGTGNSGRVLAEPVSHHGRPFSLSLTLPPLGVLFLAPEPGA